MVDSSRWMPSARTLIAGLGIAIIAIGVVTLRQPSTMFSLLGAGINPILETLSTDFFPLLVGVLLLGVGVIRGAQRRLVHDPDEGRLRPGADRSTTIVSLTGSDFDRTMDAVLGEIDRDQSTAPADEIRERLQTSAVETLVAFRDLDRAGAQEELETGTWTDDAIAAAFLSGADGPSPSFLRRVYAWLYPRQAVEQRIERTVAELQSVARPGGSDG